MSNIISLSVFPFDVAKLYYGNSQTKENIKINYENGYLTINANQDILKQTNDNYIRRERLYGEIRRSFFIGNKKEADIKALYKEGILSITFPKEELSKKSNKGRNVE